MKALIPVAGEGTRLRPHTHTVPKALLSVAGRPILGHIVERLRGAGIDEICFVTGYRGEQIREWAESTYEMPMHWVHQEEAKGLGHAVLQAAEVIGGAPVLIVLGDTLFEVDLAAVVGRPENCIGVMEVEDPSRFGVAVVEGEKVIRVVEKPEEPISHLAIAGLYRIEETDRLISSLRRLVAEDRRTQGEYQLTDGFALMLADGAVFRTFQLDAWYDCGLPETILATNRALLDRHGTVAPKTGDHSVIIPPVHIAADVEVDHSVVGPYVTLDVGARVRGSVVRNAIIGQGALVEGAVLDGSLIGDHAVVRGRPMALNVGDSSEIDFTG